MKLNDPKTINGWCFFDWANSVYSLVIISTIFPIYYTSVTTVDGSDLVTFFGIEMVNSVLYSYALSFSFLVVAISLPLLTGIADYSGSKLFFMKLFTFIGAASCAGLFWFNGANIEYGIIASILASIAYSGSLVFYNSFLPEIATFDQFDKVSAKGFSFGYVGSVLLLVLNLAMIQQPQWFGLDDTLLATKISFLTVGIWWFGFAQITFARLPKNPFNKEASGRYLFNGYREIMNVYRSLKKLPILKAYLWAFLFYNTGVQTVMYMAALFADKELGMQGGELIITILIIQIVAVAGSMFFARLSKLRGNKFSLITMLIIWVLICLAAYLTVTKTQFYILAFVVGLVMGGIQSLSRATYSKLIPGDTKDHASYFSFYDVTFNISIVVGTFAYGLIENITGSMRNSSLTLGLFFLIGLGLLAMIRIPRTQKNLSALVN